MRPEEIRKLLKAQPFEPIRFGLSDGRSILVRHPDQVVVAERHLLIGLAQLERSGPLSTPTSGDAIARDWVVLNLLHLTTIEPANGAARRSPRRRKR